MCNIIGGNKTLLIVFKALDTPFTIKYSTKPANGKIPHNIDW